MTSSVIEVLTKAVDALEAAKTGLQWYRGVMPEYVDGSDDEADDEIDSAIADLRAALAELPKSDPVHLAAGETTRTSGDALGSAPSAYCGHMKRGVRKAHCARCMRAAYPGVPFEEAARRFADEARVPPSAAAQEAQQPSSEKPALQVGADDNNGVE